MEDDVNYDPMAPKKVNLKLDRSELVLCGINQARYSGCLRWHEIISHSNDIERNVKIPISLMWEFLLADV